LSAESRYHTKFIEDVQDHLLQQSRGVKRKNSFGIKTASYLILLKNFDMVNGFILDYMHTVLLGVLKALTLQMFNSKNHLEDFYINGKRKAEADRLWMSIRVHDGCNRTIRSLNDVPHWKANELKTWLYVWILALRPHLPERVTQHLAKFTFGIMLLLQRNVKVEDIAHSNHLLREFAKDNERVFGHRNCSSNIHLLIHASDCVANWGPLWY